MLNQPGTPAKRCWQLANCQWIVMGMLALLCCSCRALDSGSLWSASSTSAVEQAADQSPQTSGENETPQAQTPAPAPAATSPQATSLQPAHPVPAATTPRGLPPSAWSGYPPHPTAAPIPAAGSMGHPWSPPGLPQPWPSDEYVLDGGDRARQVNVAQDWSVHGLDEEDTVVHFDTLQGDLVIQPSNRVAVYAPRFAAVRRIDGIVQNEYSFGTLSSHQVVELRLGDDALNTRRLTQQLQPKRHLGLTTPNGFRERLPDRSVDNVQNAAGTASVFESHEDFSIIRRGVFDNNEKPRLNQRIQAARSWSTEQGVQVVLDGKIPTEFSNGRSTGEHFTYEMPEGKKRLRVVKVASAQQALSGDIIEFTIRFDNTGDQSVGNVTVLDNLTPRLKYIEASQSCSLKSKFATQVNNGQSLVLRWEIIDPLKVGEGGIIRFKCRVR